MARYTNVDREIMVGDRVRVTGNCDAIHFSGEMGYVRTTDNGGHDAGIEFDEIFSSALHWLGGRLSDGRGYYVYAHNLEYAGDTETETTPAIANTPRCSCCGRAVDDAFLGTRLFKDTLICNTCVKRKIGAVHDYHHAKNFKYLVDADKITFGAEIEIDAGYDTSTEDRDELIAECIEYARTNKYPLIMSYERDGSLNCGGVECVTAPLTIDDFKSPAVKNQLKYLFASAEDMGFNTDDENHAGLHIHVGRKSLCGADRAIGDAVGLLMGWAVTRLWHKGFRELSRRGDMGYCRLNDYEGTGYGLESTEARYDRYYCVNIQNSKTIELRIFNNATCYEDVLLAVDVCYMLGKWATKKINAFLKRDSYSARGKMFADALAYADRVTWDALVKYSKFPEVTLPRLRRAGVEI